MITSQAKGVKLETNLLQVPKKYHPFDTQISLQPQPHIEDKGFSPWIKQKTIIHHQYSPQQMDYHRFLAKIRISPKYKGQLKKNVNPQDNNLEMIKADLSCKLKAQKIGNRECLDDRIKIQSVNRSFFQRRANLAKIYKRPKSIDLSLEFQPQNALKCSPFAILNAINSDQPTLPNNKKQLRTVHKSRKKKQETDEQKFFSQTMNDFHMNILSTQKKAYQTLQLNFDGPQQTIKKPYHDIIQLRTISVFNKPKFSKTKPTKQILQPGENLACQGKNALINFGHRTCHQKIREQHKANKKQQIDKIFIV